MDIKTYREFLREVNGESFCGSIIISGEDKELIEKSVKDIYKKANSFEEFNIVTLSGDEITLNNIINACETLPFMCERKVIHIKNPPFLKKENNSQMDKQNRSQWSEIINFLIEYINDIPDQIILLITITDNMDNKNKLVSLIKNLGVAVEYRILKGEDLQKWTMELFKNYGKTISKSELIYFLKETGNSVRRIEIEVNKLSSYALEESNITRKHIDAIINRDLESNIFKMTDNIISKNVNDAILILDRLLFQREDFKKILGMIIRQFRLLYMVKSDIMQNRNSYEIKEKHKLNDFVLKNLIRQCERYNIKDIKKAMSKCLNIDYSIKNGNIPPELSLEMLIVELCK